MHTCPGGAKAHQPLSPTPPPVSVFGGTAVPSPAPRAEAQQDSSGQSPPEVCSLACEQTHCPGEQKGGSVPQKQTSSCRCQGCHLARRGRRAHRGHQHSFDTPSTCLLAPSLQPRAGQVEVPSLSQEEGLWEKLRPHPRQPGLEPRPLSITQPSMDISARLALGPGASASRGQHCAHSSSLVWVAKVGGGQKRSVPAQRR